MTATHLENYWVLLKHDSHFGDQALVARALHLQLLWTPRYASDRMIVNILSEATDR